MARQNTSAEVDQAQLEEARNMWRHFAFGTKWFVIVHVIGLLLLAALLL